MIVRGIILSILTIGCCHAQGMGNMFSGAGPLDVLPKFTLVPETPEALRIDHAGDILYDRDRNTILYTGSPQVKIVTDTGVEMFANKALLHLNEKTADLEGGVSVYQGTMTTRGDKMHYNWDTQEMTTHALKGKVDGFILESGKFEIKNGDDEISYYEGKDAGVTLQDISHPDSWFRADKIRLYPEDKVVFNNMLVYAGNMPIFYLPYFSHSLNPMLGYLPIPGSRTPWGAYLKNEYGFVLGEKYVSGGIPTGDYIGVMRLDYRTRRGMGYGFDVVDVKLEKQASDFSGLSLYFANDSSPEIQIEGIPRVKVGSERWRIALQQKQEIRKKTDNTWGWSLFSNLNVMSDQYMLVDFFPTLVMADQTPDNALFATGTKGNHVWTSLVRFAPNDYYWTNTRLPELTWDRVRGAVEQLNIQYEGNASMSIMSQYQPTLSQMYLRNELAGLAPDDPRRRELETILNTSTFSRVNTYHEIAKPKTYDEFLTLTPKLGGGYTGYYGGADGSFHRGLFFGGVDCDVKITGEFPNVRSDLFGLNTLKHILQPYVNYSYVSTNQLDSSFPQIDGLSVTTNPNSLSVGRFTAIDSLASWNIVRMGVRNTFLTNRGGEQITWAQWDVFMDGYLQDPELDRNFSNLYSLLSWEPSPWWRFNMQNNFPVLDDGAGYQEHAFFVTFVPFKILELTTGFSTITSHPKLADSELLNGGFNIRLSEKSALAALYRWQLIDNTLERQEYSYQRNMGSWVVGIGYYSDYNRIQYDRGVMITFTLKDFPATNIPVKFSAGGE